MSVQRFTTNDPAKLSIARMWSDSMRPAFDRKTFDPVSNFDHRKWLRGLRSMGYRRSFLVECDKTNPKNQFHGSRYSEAALYTGVFSHKGEGRVYLDLGCGHSADAYLADKLGWIAYGVDLFDLDKEWVRHKIDHDVRRQMIRADIVEGLPFASRTVTACSSAAVIDLIKPHERILFYAEVHRVLQPFGVFSLTAQKLANGWGYNLYEEMNTLKRIGFTFKFINASCFKATKNPFK